MSMLQFHVPASGGEDYDGSSTTLEGGLHRSDGRDIRRVGGQRGQTTQRLKQLLVENGCLRLSADLCVYRNREREREGDTHTHTHTHRGLSQVESSNQPGK